MVTALCRYPYTARSDGHGSMQVSIHRTIRWSRLYAGIHTPHEPATSTPGCDYLTWLGKCSLAPLLPCSLAPLLPCSLAPLLPCSLRSNRRQGYRGPYPSLSHRQSLSRRGPEPDLGCGLGSGPSNRAWPRVWVGFGAGSEPGLGCGLGLGLAPSSSLLARSLVCLVGWVRGWLRAWPPSLALEPGLGAWPRSLVCLVG
jgi:hypothetical protein